MSDDTPTQPANPHPTPPAAPPLSAAADENVSRKDADTTMAASPTDTRPEALPSSVGTYKILGVLGVGGMGAVYEAEQTSPKRRVALKVIKPGSVSPSLLKRFEREADVLGRLQHPGIAQVYEAGTAPTESGGPPVPYFAMELIRGTTLTRYADNNKLELRQRLDLVTRICDAVQYAHQQGVVHRDLKPGNILVDANGQPKILDFGIAKIAGNETHLATMETQVGQLVGTLAYMSPEQARGEVDKLDTRSDIYALGVIAYELLAGKLPYDLKQAVILEAVRVICEEDPTPLSSIDRKYGGDIETIIAKAMAKEKERRYTSVAEFSSDIKRFLNDEPIAARPPSTWYQLSKFAKRNKTFVTGTILVAAMLVLGVIATTWQAVRATRALEVAETQRRAKEEARAAADSERKASEEARATAQQSEAAAEMARSDARRNAVNATDALIAQGSSLLVGKRIAEATNLFWQARAKYIAHHVATDRADHALCAAHSQQPPELLTFPQTSGTWGAVAISPDGRMALTGCDDNTIKQLDLVTARIVQTLRGHTDRITGIAFSRDGQIAASSSKDCTIRIWNLATGEESRKFTEQYWFWAVAFTPNGRFVVTANQDRLVKVRELSTGQVTQTMRGHSHAVRGLAVSPDGRTALTGDWNNIVKQWDLETGNELHTFEGHTDSVLSTAISPDGLTGLSCGNDKSVRLWNLTDGKLIQTLLGHEAHVSGAAFSPDGHTVLTTGADDTFRMWDVASGKQLRVWLNPSADLFGIAVSPDGRFAITGGRDRMVKMWDLSPGRDVHTLWGHGAPVVSVAISPDGRIAVSGGYESNLIKIGDTHTRLGIVDGLNLRFWDVATGKCIRAVFGHEFSVNSIAIAPDGRHVLTGGGGNMLKLWEMESGRLIRTFKGHAESTPMHSEAVRSVSISEDGETAISGSTDYTVKLWELSSGKVTRTFTGHTDTVCHVAFSPDGRRAVSSDNNATIKWWSLASGKEVQSFSYGKGGELIFASSADGRYVAIGNRQTGPISILDAYSGSIAKTCKGPTNGVDAIVYSADRRAIFASEHGGTVRELDVMSGEEIMRFTGHSGTVCSMARSRDGHTLISGGFDTTVKVWDFSRTAQYATAATEVPNSQAALQKDPNDVEALRTIGEWHAFRGLNAWAVELLEKVRSRGGAVDSLTLARCYWQLADEPMWRGTRTREDCLHAAGQEFTKAIATSSDPEEAAYLKLCADAVRRHASVPASTQPTRQLP